MRALNKMIPMIPIVIMSMNMSGCGNSAGTNAGQPPETSAAVRSVDEGNDSDNGSSEMFSEVTVYGKKFIMPCKASDFKGDFSVKELDVSKGLYTIMYKEAKIGNLYCKEKTDLDKDIPDSVYFYYSDEIEIGELSGISPTYDSILERYNAPADELKADDGDWADLYYSCDNYSACLSFEYDNDDLYLSGIRWVFL